MKSVGFSCQWQRTEKKKAVSSSKGAVPFINSFFFYFLSANFSLLYYTYLSLPGSGKSHCSKVISSWSDINNAILEQQLLRYSRAPYMCSHDNKVRGREPLMTCLW